MTIDEIDDGLEYAGKTLVEYAVMTLAKDSEAYATHKPSSAIKAAQKIIDKERPHEVYTIGGGTGLHCVCGQLICDKRDAAELSLKGYKYCPACGRKIGWSEYEADEGD